MMCAKVPSMTTNATKKAIRRMELRRSNAAGVHGYKSNKTKRRQDKQSLKKEDHAN